MKDIKSTQSDNALNKASTNPRRQFFKKAAIGSALLTTISSRPVWAVGCTVSGQMSGNLSNPDRDDCSAAATGKSPGYWKRWEPIFNFFENNPDIAWADMSKTQKKKFKFSGEGNSINVLYNWVKAADNSDNRIQLPAIKGVKTPMSNILSKGGSSHDDFNYCGALLSTAHPSIPFPYPSNTWTLKYLIDNHTNTDTYAETQVLIADFFQNHLEPSLPLYNGKNKKAAFNWAKGILGF